MIDIQGANLLLGFLLLLVPVVVFLVLKIRLVKDLLYSVLRMVVQLSLVAVYLEWIFEKNNAWINSLWVLMMVLIGAGTIVKRVKLNWRIYLVPIILAGMISMLIIDGFFLGLVIQLDYVFDARYFVPISGMVLGNSLNHNIVGLSTYFDGLIQKKELYYFILTNSGSKKMALMPFIQEAFLKSLNPLLANMSVIGLISLPGMMTGQILGGASPVIAIKYQLMIILAIFIGCVMMLGMSILFSGRYLFDKYGRVGDLNR